MSLDFQLAWSCPHLTVEEHVPLESDRRSLRTRQPVASSGSVRLLVNDEVIVPQSGLYSPARLVGAVSGPYDVSPGKDTLHLRTPLGEHTFRFGVRRTTRYTAEEVTHLLRRSGFTGADLSVERGHLVIAEISTVGPESFVEVSGTAAAVLGFGSAGENWHQRKARGSMLYPGWQLVTPSGEITSRFPRFTQPVRSNPVIKLTYAVPGQRCLRCGGTLVENDVRVDTAGQMITIRDENLLYQAALKILLTAKGSNPYHPWYGSDISTRIGSKALPGVAALLNEDVRRALGKIQTLQAEQAKYQTVSFKERLYAIRAVNVRQHEQDPTTYLVDVTVQNASGAPIDLSIVFTVPSVVALMGSNGLFLGTEQAGVQPDHSLAGRG